MYYRIKNQFDAKILADEITELGSFPHYIADRIIELAKILDDAYGGDRGSYAMGGYVLLFPNEHNYSVYVNQILGFYNLDLEDFEYSEIVGEKIMDDRKIWKEELYLLGSDDSLVLIHPKEVVNV